VVAKFTYDKEKDAITEVTVNNNWGDNLIFPVGMPKWSSTDVDFISNDKAGSFEEITEFNYAENIWVTTYRRIREDEMAQEQKKIQGDDKDPMGGGLNYQLPDTKNILQKLDDAYAEELKDEHKQEMEEEEKQDKGKAAAKKKKRTAGGQICVCGSPGCYIGPMRGTDGKEVEE